MKNNQKKKKNVNLGGCPQLKLSELKPLNTSQILVVVGRFRAFFEAYEMKRLKIKKVTEELNKKSFDEAFNFGEDVLCRIEAVAKRIKEKK